MHKKKTLRERIVAFINARRKAVAVPVTAGVTWLALHVGLDVDPSVAAGIGVAISTAAVNYVANVVERIKLHVLDTRY